MLLPRTPGSYALVLASAITARIIVGRLGVLKLQPGHYVYVGSVFGPGGLRARIEHHQHRVEHPHWHIDYLRRYTRLIWVWYCSGARCEHSWATQLRAISGATVPMPGFGSSDCQCDAHLFWLVNGPRDFPGLFPQPGLEPKNLRLTVAAASFTAGCCDCLPCAETTCLQGSGPRS